LAQKGQDYEVVVVAGGIKIEIHFMQFRNRGEFVSTHPAFALIAKPPGWSLSYVDKDYSFEYEQTITGDEVWLGLRATIKDGITISDGAIVAAGAVVSTDVPSYAIKAECLLEPFDIASRTRPFGSYRNSSIGIQMVGQG
jgi:hypothetical protein